SKDGELTVDPRFTGADQSVYVGVAAESDTAAPSRPTAAMTPSTGFLPRMRGHLSFLMVSSLPRWPPVAARCGKSPSGRGTRGTPGGDRGPWRAAGRVLGFVGGVSAAWAAGVRRRWGDGDRAACRQTSCAARAVAAGDGAARFDGSDRGRVVG